jgi:gamma-glutamyl:cysteine ligase YbdK (ATP-grasp superfamily)
MEVKTEGPARSFEGLAARFHAAARDMNALAQAHGVRLMPGAMHPWMDPERETRVWPHSNAEIYSAYDRLFDCRRHGWANLQSVHLNLPFADEREFARLMAAVRIALPLIPALAASSPVVEGRATGFLDSRLDVYRTNSHRAPAMTGAVIPEPVYDYEAYRHVVLDPIDVELERLGADEVLLRQPFTNARGAIARFDRNAIELRLIDAQERPRADLAVAAAVSGLVRGLVEERWCAHAQQAEQPTAALTALLDRAIERGPAATLEPAYTALFGTEALPARTAGELLRRVAEGAFDGSGDLEPALEIVLREGTLAERMLRALGTGFVRDDLRRVCTELCACLDEDRPFLA